MTNNTEEVRGRCKTKDNIKVREEAVVAKIDGVDDDENEETQGREAQDEQEEFGSRKVVRKHDPRQPSEQEREEHEMTHLPFRSWWTRRGLSQNDGGRAASPRSSFGQRDHGRLDIAFFLIAREKRDKSRAQYSGSEEDDGRMGMSKTDGVAS